jgi:hypothetical protein
MKVDFVVTMDDGKVLRGSTNLSTTAAATTSQDPKGTLALGIGTPELNFSLPTRAFMKRYAADLSGPKKLTLLVARLVEGQTNTLVARTEIEGQWKKMKGLLGGRYNSAYDTRARDSGWISSPKAGVFQLLDGWAGAIELGD